MKLLKFLFFSIFLILLGCSKNQKNILSNISKPNILIIYLDDLGYGDVSAYNKGKIQTPNIDKLANNGLKFTNGYSSSATCSPSRYALLTGKYPWRNPNAKIITGGSLIIDTTEVTLPKVLNSNGYYSGIVGKWHLGLGNTKINYNSLISPGPNQVGFNYSYIMADTQDRVPCVYIENGKVVNLDDDDPIEVNFAVNSNFDDYNLPTGLNNPELTNMKWHHGHNGSIINGVPRIGYMKGGENALWSDIDMADHFLKKANEFLEENKENNFFLFYSLQQPHVPRTPHPRFEGLSGMGPRGDVILEADWCIGQIYKTLEKLDLLKNTLIILSSDNGPVLNDGYYDNAVELLGDHDPFGGLRGGKYSLFEAGTKVPFIAYWKNTIQSGISNEIISQIDLLSSISSIVGDKFRSRDGQDLSNLILNNHGKGRKELIIEATTRTAFRSGDWVMIPPYNGVPVNKNVNIELGNSNEYKLFNIKNDPSQRVNLIKVNNIQLQKMIKRYKSIIGDDMNSPEKLILE